MAFANKWWGSRRVATALLLAVSPAAGDGLTPAPVATWWNPGHLYADAVLMTTYASEVTLSQTGDRTEPAIALEPAGTDPTGFVPRALWTIPPPVAAGAAFVILTPPADTFVQVPEPLQVEVFAEELGPQPFLPEAALSLSVDENAPILCCDAWTDAAVGLRKSLPGELLGLLVPPGAHDSCLRVSDSKLRLDVDLDHVQRLGASSPYTYEFTTDISFDLASFYSDDPYVLLLDARWLALGPEECVPVERTDWRDQSIETFDICPADFAAQFPAVTSPDAILPPVWLPSPVDCGLGESATLDPSGNLRALPTNEWCFMMQPHCAVYANAWGVNPEELEAACAPCAEFFETFRNDVSGDAPGEGNETSDGGCTWSPHVAGRRADGSWPLLLIAGLVLRARRATARSWSA